MIGKSVQHLRAITKQDDWETPKKLYQQACKMCGIDPILDVCATALTTKCTYFISKKHNAFDHNWNKDFFMNPPYSEVAKWIERAVSEVNKHHVRGLVLTFAKTDTKWWHIFIENSMYEIHFQQGRIKFLHDGKVGKYAAPYPSVWIVMYPC